jgi:hypothetical protein
LDRSEASLPVNFYMTTMPRFWPDIAKDGVADRFFCARGA